jgi:predicted protein tyrosine phosphatase
MKRILFVCSQNRLRSLTAERIFSDLPDWQVASAGLAHDARLKVNADLVGASDLIFVMEKPHEETLRRRFRNALTGVEVICLEIPDQYAAMDPALIRQLREKVRPYLERFMPPFARHSQDRCG